MTELQQKIADFSHTSTPAWLGDVRARGQAVWRSTLWPTRKTESWKYTSLKALEQGDYFSAPVGLAQRPAEIDADRLSRAYAVDNLDAYRVVFVNGVVSEGLSEVHGLPEGAELTSFQEANEAQRELIQTYLDSVVETDRHLFAALNNQLLDNGLFLHVAKNQRLDKPVHVVHLTTRQDESFQVPQRLLVVLDEHAEATVIEHFVSDAAEQNAFTHGVTELCLAQGARLEHYRLHLEEEHALHIGGVHAALGRNAVLDSFHLALGSTLKRIDLVVNHNGEGADSHLNGVYLPRREQHVDYHTCIEHRAAHCTSQENFRGIIGDSGKAVFNGRIHIHPHAQKTLAQLSNKNLLTSDKAEVNTKPELEIYADDVQCAHGATVAQLDETALHYFGTRGISRKEAEVMLSFGFINELLNKARNQPVANHLRPLLATLFARDPKLVRHIL